MSIEQLLDNPAWPDVRRLVESNYEGGGSSTGILDHGGGVVEPPIDSQGLMRRCMGNMDFAARVLRRFAGQFGGDVDQLRSSLIESDAGSVARIAHRLKGTSANVSAVRLQAIAKEIEDLAAVENLSEVSDRVDEMLDAWNELVSSMAPRGGMSASQ